MKRLEDLHQSVLGHITTIEATYLTARNAIELGVPGDFVECGVYAGAQSAAMARAIQDNWHENGTRFTVEHGKWPGYARRVHLFDSFNGFPQFSEHDSDLAAGGWKAGDTRCSLADVQANMQRWGIPDELLVYHPGWFSATMPLALRDPDYRREHRCQDFDNIAVLRLDADLYESTYAALQYLYPLVSPGGFVICDDYNLDGCRKALHEFLMPAPIYWRRHT